MRAKYARNVVGVGVLAAAMALSACGGSSDSGSSKKSSSADLSACVTQAKKIVAGGEEAPTLTVPKIDGGVAAVAGKSAWFIGPTVGSSLILGAANGVKGALAAAKMKTHVVDAEDTVSQNSAIKSAVNAHTNVIFIDAIPTATVSAALGEASAAHIPVVSIFEEPTSEQTKAAVKADLLVDSTKVAQLMGAYALTKTGCKASTGYLYGQQFTVHKELLTALKDMYAKLCPDTCTLYPQTYDPPKANTTVGPLAVNLVARHPKMNTMILGTDVPLATVTSPALKAAGKKVITISEGGTPAAINLIKPDSIFQADVTLSKPVVLGWTAADIGLRILSGQKPTDSDSLYYRLLTPESKPSLGEYFPGFSTYQEKFKTAWGLGS